jgi:arylsulfatase A-like enzyme
MKHLFLTLLAAFSVPLAAQDKPNIILMMADDMGYGDLGANGGKIIQTPNLDLMAAGGMRLTRFYAASAVCSPTRASVATGRNPFRVGVPGANSGHMKAEEITVAEFLKSQGYITGHFGKWHLGTLSKTVAESNRGGPKGVAHYAPPWDNGFDVCFSTEAKTPTYDPMLKPAEKASRQGWDYIQDKATAVPYGTHYWNGPDQMVKDNLEGDDSRVIMDRAIPFVEKAVKEKKPFFAIIWFHAPHLPVVAGPKHVEPYKHYDMLKRNYYGCITALDEQVGRLRTTLGRIGASQNTMLTFCSDNGPEGGASSPGSALDFRGRKRSLYEGGVRVPGLIEWPARIKRGTVTAFPAVTSDYLPTIADMLGADLPKRPYDGISLLPLFDGKATERKAPIGFQYGGQVSLTGDRYKLVGSKGGGKKKKKGKAAEPGGKGKYELYDLLADPSEKTDIAARHPEIVRRMTNQLEQWIEACRESSEGADY